MEGNLQAAIAMETHVWAQTGATLSASPNRRMLQGGQAHVAAEDAHAAMEAGGINKSSSYFIFANLSYKSALCASTPNALYKELWCRRLALKLGGGEELCSFLFIRCLLIVECIQTAMLEGLSRSGGRRPNRGAGRSGGKRPTYEGLDVPQSTY